MSVSGFLIHVSADIASCILYDFCVKEVNRVVGDFMCEFYGWYHTVKVFDEFGERIVVSIPN